jgi:hypothetical protein
MALQLLAVGFAACQKKTENVILITLDGMRWQEVFGGAELRLLTNSKFVGDTAAAKKMYWLPKAEQRREQLMPFFWNVIAKQGQLYGNRLVGNKVNVTNKMWFSYPGYHEILSGFADDTNIHSNDPVNNPNETVLEHFNKQSKYAGKVAAFTSWETFPWIINTTRSKIPVNSGFAKTLDRPTEKEALMNELMFQLPTESGGTRLDAFTFHYAFEYLKKNRPNVLYISFDETDHFAHEAKYDKYLASAQYTDKFIRTLWEWVQDQPDYRDKTTLIIATDHGRGDVEPDDWRHHGNKMQHCDEVWFAFIGPDTAPLGEVKSSQQLFQNQIAATMAALLKSNYTEKRAGAIISTAIGK